MEDGPGSKTKLADPSLALALGGEGVTLRDLAMLYAALGDEGLARPLAWTREAAAPSFGATPGQGGRELQWLTDKAGSAR